MGQNESSEMALAREVVGTEQNNRGRRARVIGSSESSQHANFGVANLKSELDNISSGSVDSGALDEDDDFEHALEYGLADDTNQFFDVDNGTGMGNDGARSPLTEEEREHLREELKKTDDEIATLRQVLTARLKYANDLKRKLGVTPWTEVQQDLTQGIKNVKESQAYHRTEEALHQASDAVAKKLGQIRSSNTFKSFEEKVGSAYNNVKAKIVASTSIDQLAGQRQSNANSAAGTQPNTPSTEKMNLP